MDSDLKRRLVSAQQLQSLLEFMREHPELARGLCRGRRGKLMTLKVWNACAQKLNAMADGAEKDGKGWSKYWCDWKYRVRRHALEIRVARDTNKIPPEGIAPLTAIEETIMSIIGDSSIDEVVVKNDPLGDEDSNDEDAENDGNDSDVPINQYQEARSKAVKRRRTSKDESTSQNGENEDQELGSPPEQRPRVKEEAGDLYREAEDSTAQFLHLERMQFENAKKIQESMSQISLEICKLTDILSDIRDALGIAELAFQRGLNDA